MGKHITLGFEIDAITNSIRNVISGDSFQTEVYRLAKIDLKQVTKKNKWNFNWKSEFENNAKEVYKLTIVNNPSIIQGLLSLSIKHYKNTLNAKLVGSQRMIIDTSAANILIGKYFKNE